MLDKQKLINLNREGKYDEINEIFSKEYDKILRDFVNKKKNMDCSNMTLSEVLSILETIDDGKYVIVCNIMESMNFSEEETNTGFLNKQIDNYNEIIQKLK